MAKRVEDEDGLTPHEAKASLYRAQGMSQSDAYRKAFNKPRASAKTINEKACRLFAKPAVQARVRELLKASKLQDMVSIGEWGDMTLDKIMKAENSGNWNAVMQGLRLLGQGLGALKDTVSMTVEERTSDADLIERLAGGDAAKATALQRILGVKDSFDA